MGRILFLIVLALLAGGCASLDELKPLLALGPLQGCKGSDLLQRSLENYYGEVRVAVGASQDGVSLIELYKGTRDDTFTIIVTGSSGISCAIAAGFHLADVASYTD